jgi:formylmethanofuran dehydrogenase subunit B
MKTYTAICPKCGAVNDNLYLEETDGSFECCHCLTVCQADRSLYDGSKRNTRRSPAVYTVAGKSSITHTLTAANA